ncbi:MAG TPA: hypothetical protein PKW63_09625, partial [Vicinamibacterales bacterium]|nr:hypothetical protein [Vicinamibacterales bacterium]
MRNIMVTTLALLAMSVPAGPEHYIFFGRERQRISEPAFLENKNIAGAQLKYTWRELEPARDQYALKPLLDDLAFLERHGKRLFVQLQDVSFSEEVPVPDYLREDPAFGGGVARERSSLGGLAGVA